MTDGQLIKQPLCYACGLRMSMLFQHTPPPTLKQFLRACDTEGTCADPAPGEDGLTIRDERLCPDCLPIQDDTHHSRFVIIHETHASAQRYLDRRQHSRNGAAGQDDGAFTYMACMTAKTADDDDDPHSCQTPSLPLLCVACLGLYQFMDYIHAPAIAAAVRRSPYTDCTGISVNVNVSRAFTFTWLAAATLYFDNCHRQQAPPSAQAPIQTHTSNMCTTMPMTSEHHHTAPHSLLVQSHSFHHGGPHHDGTTSEETDSAPHGRHGHHTISTSSGSMASLPPPATSEARPGRDVVVPEELSNFKELYMRDLRARVLSYLCISHDQLIAMSRRRRQTGSEPAVLAQHHDHSSPSSAAVALSHSCSSVLPAGIHTYRRLVQATCSTDHDAALVCRTGCECVASGESAVPAACRRLRESTTSRSLSSKRARVEDEQDEAQDEEKDEDEKAHRAATESEVCAGQALVYNNENTSIIVEVYCRHDTAEELLTQEHLLPRQYMSNRSSCVLTYGVIYDYVMPFLQRKQLGCGALMAHKQREESRDGRRACEAGENVCGESVSSSWRRARAASVSCEVSHARLFLMGNYRKLSREMSQSPWFIAGKRIGTFSLQEVIANAVIPFFYPHRRRSDLAATRTNELATHDAEHDMPLSDKKKHVDMSRTPSIQHTAPRRRRRHSMRVR